jgi:hypothetical protein
MAKGQKRSTREIRKPKQVKSSAPAAEPTLGSQVKNASNSNQPAGKSGKR